MNLFAKQKQRETQRANMWTSTGKGKEVGNKLGDWDRHKHTTLHRIDN